jgi:hypothetical protein
MGLVAEKIKVRGAVILTRVAKRRAAGSMAGAALGRYLSRTLHLPVVPPIHIILYKHILYSPCVSAGEARVCDETHSDFPSNSIDPALLKGDERKRTLTSNGEQRKRHHSDKGNLIRQKLTPWKEKFVSF